MVFERQRSSVEVSSGKMREGEENSADIRLAAPTRRQKKKKEEGSLTRAAISQ